MKSNSVAKVILWIGGGIITLGVIGSLFVGFATDNFTMLIIGILSSVISGVLLIGFSEIINLLQLSVYKTEKLIKMLDRGANEKKESPSDR